MSTPSDAPDTEDRVIAAAVSAVAAGATVIVFVIALAYILPAPPLVAAPTFMTVLASAPIWAAGVGVAAGVAGYALGTRRTADAFGHLWMTAWPERPWVSLLMWSTIAIIGLLAYVVVAHAI